MSKCRNYFHLQPFSCKRLFILYSGWAVKADCNCILIEQTQQQPVAPQAKLDLYLNSQKKGKKVCPVPEFSYQLTLWYSKQAVFKIVIDSTFPSECFAYIACSKSWVRLSLYRSENHETAVSGLSAMCMKHLFTLFGICGYDFYLLAHFLA